MKAFAYGSAEQFAKLDQDLSDGQYYKFPNRRLPAGCSPSEINIWFAKIQDVYGMYTDKRVQARVDHPDFMRFLENGEIKFLCMEDLAAFLHSLRPLFPAPDGNTGTMVTGSPAGGGVVNRKKLSKIQAEGGKPKRVRPEELAEPLKRKVFGQDRALEALADKVVINRMRKEEKLLAVALLGPTATGKSETAKSLAEVMSEAYGEPYGYLEIAGSEFVGAHTVHRFFGAPPGYVGHGQATILEPVRKNPRHVIVINEVEKADEAILTGLMEAVDTGLVGMADNSRPIDLNQSILLFTSNIPIDMEQYQAAGEFERSELCRDAFTKHCGRPEISGKIGNFLAFEPLNDEAATDVIIKFIREELDSYGLKLAHIDEYLMADFLKHQTKYGARGLRGLVGDSVGRQLLRDWDFDAAEGKSVDLKGTIGQIEFEIAD